MLEVVFGVWCGAFIWSYVYRAEAYCAPQLDLKVKLQECELEQFAQ